MKNVEHFGWAFWCLISDFAVIWGVLDTGTVNGYQAKSYPSYPALTLLFFPIKKEYFSVSFYLKI
jgi:hypothetical protein